MKKHHLNENTSLKTIDVTIFNSIEIFEFN